MKKTLMSAAAMTLAAAAIAILPAAPAQARQCPTQWQCVRTYFAEPEKTTVVGVQTETCSGGVLLDGVRSAYSTYVQRPCFE